MKIRTGRRYEGIPASSAIAMSVMEQSGIRAKIDSCVEYDPKRKLSPGMAVKAMVGAMHETWKRPPLYHVNNFYRPAPNDILFGAGVTCESLNDHAIARNLDSIFDAVPEKVYHECAAVCKRKFGFDSKIRHADATDYPVFVISPEDERKGAALPAFCGAPKDKRKDLLHYVAAAVTDGDRILGYCKAYPGGTSDCVINADTIEYLKKYSDPLEDTVVADCKLVNSGMIRDMCDSGFGFVSKVPSSFSEKIRDRIIEKALSSGMNNSSIEGYTTCDTDAETTECGTLRFIAYRSPKGTKREMDYLERQGERDAEKLFKVFGKKRFACEADAVSAFGDAMKKHVNSAYIVSGCPVRIAETVRRNVRGRPPKGSPEQETKVTWKIDVSMEFDEQRATELAHRRGISVIVTNLPRTSEDSGNPRNGATADAVLQLYLDQYKVEHSFRLMKSDMGVSPVFVKMPSRANALLFVVAIATLVSNIIDALIRRSGEGRLKTMKQFYAEMQNTSVEYHRDGNEMSLVGAKESTNAVCSCMDVLGIDLSSLLETSDG